MEKRFLVVSVHDVSPLTWRKVEIILGNLDRIGIDKRSLLVIPNHRSAAPVDRAEPEFQRWLKAASTRDEICLHGYEHQARALRGGAVKRLVATVYTNREGEFYQLNGGEATERLRRGLDHFANVGIRAEGFVAPAWLMNSNVETALRQAGFRYTTRLRSIDILSEPVQRLRAPTLCYSVRSGWRRTVSRLWNPALLWMEKRSGILRAALHPADLDHPPIFRQILGLLRRAVRERAVATYREVVEFHCGKP